MDDASFNESIERSIGLLGEMKIGGVPLIVRQPPKVAAPKQRRAAPKPQRAAPKPRAVPSVPTGFDLGGLDVDVEQQRAEFERIKKANERKLYKSRQVKVNKLWVQQPEPAPPKVVPVPPKPAPAPPKPAPAAKYPYMNKCEVLSGEGTLIRELVKLGYSARALMDPHAIARAAKKEGLISKDAWE
jgi:hypothetical protein